MKKTLSLESFSRLLCSVEVADYMKPAVGLGVSLNYGEGSEQMVSTQAILGTRRIETIYSELENL